MMQHENDPRRRRVEQILRDDRVWNDGALDIDAMLARLQRERDDAAKLSEAIVTGPATWWRQRLETTPGAKTAGMVEELVERWRGWLGTSPERAEILTAMAVELAESLPDSAYPATQLAIVRGQALRDHAYVLSFRGRFPEAMRYVERAEGVLDGVPAAIGERGRVMIVKALILRSLHRFDEAVHLARQAAAIFLRLGDRQRYVNARSTEGAVVYETGAIAEAKRIWSSLENDPGLDHRGTIGLAHNIALCLADLGQYEAAIPQLYRCLVQFEALGMDTERTRCRASLGHALLKNGRMLEAVPILRRAAQEFGELGMVWDMGLTSLELAEALLATDQPHEVPDLCRHVIAEYARIGIAAHATTALAYLREATRLDSRAFTLVRDASLSLRRLPAAQPQLFGRG